MPMNDKEASSKQRPLLLLLLLVLLAALLFNRDKFGFTTSDAASTSGASVVQNQQVKSLKLDEGLKANISMYFSGIDVKPNENSIAYATKLDHGTGRKLLIAAKYKEAYPVYQKILKISFNQGSLMGVGISLGALSNMMHRMHEKDESIKLAFLEYKVSKASGKRFEYGVTQQRIAVLMESQSRSLAMSWRLRARENLKGTPYKEDYINLLNNTARDLALFNHQEQALAVYEEAYQSSQSLGGSPAHRTVKLRLVSGYMEALNESEQYQKSIDIGHDAIAKMKEDVRSTNLNYRVLYQLGESYRGLNDPLKASEYYGSAYRFYEESRANALGDKARAKIDNSNWDLVNRLIDSYIDQEDYYQALALLESNKARTLSDIEEDANQKGIYAELTKLNRLHAKQRTEYFDTPNVNLGDVIDKALYPEPIEGKDHIKEYRALRNGFEELLDKQHEELARLKISSEIRDVAISQTITAKQIKNLQERLGKHQAVISLYARRDSVAVFLLTDSQIALHVSALNFHQAIRQVKKLQAALINPHVDLYSAPAKELADEVMQPVLSKISKQVTSLIYSTDSNFADIPLGALPYEEGFLVQKFNIARVPSLKLIHHSTGQNIENVSHGISCVDPEIPFARLVFQRETGDELKRIYGANLTNLVGKACSPDNLEKAISSTLAPTFLHIGSHGRFYKTRSMNSGLLLSSSKQVETYGQGHVWDARAIGSVDLSSIGLVSIASREAALTDKTLRRDVFGLMRALLFGGVKSVVAPLWAVQDKAASELMKNFYNAYKKGSSAKESLRQAQLKLIGSQQFSHPFYWSGFVVTEVAQ